MDYLRINKGERLEVNSSWMHEVSNPISGVVCKKFFEALQNSVYYKGLTKMLKMLNSFNLIWPFENHKDTSILSINLITTLSN